MPEFFAREQRGYRGPRRHLVPFAASIAAHAALLAAIIYLVPPLAHRPTSIVLAYLIEVGGGGNGNKARGAVATSARFVAGAPGDAAAAAATSLAPTPPAVPAHPHRHRARTYDDSSARDADAARDAAEVAAHRPSAPSAGLPVSAGPAAPRGGSGGTGAGEGASVGAGGSGGSDGTGISGAYARYGSNPPPLYPERARRHGEQGTVTLHVLVAADGAVERVELAASSGFDSLDRSALDTIRARWRFVPARRDGIPIESWVLVPIRFTLTEASAY